MELFEQTNTVLGASNFQSWLDPLADKVWSQFAVPKFQLNQTDLLELIRNSALSGVSVKSAEATFLRLEFSGSSQRLRFVRIALSNEKLELEPEGGRGEITFDARLFWVWGSVKSHQRTAFPPRLFDQTTSHSGVAVMSGSPSDFNVTVWRRQIVLESLGDHPTTEADLLLRLRRVGVTTNDINAALRELLKEDEIQRATGFEQRFGGQLIPAYRRK